jgi:hypothetical protein
MYSASLHGLLVQAHVDELDRAIQTYHRRRDVNRPAAAPLSILINRALRRQS